ncbi:AP2-like ethylene-responsive transcription factor AIL6 [Glycine max]|nr:AP2-like ethylene-responsive transcription factor AIL6 [Glycine max]
MVPPTMLSTRVTSYTPSPYESTDWKFFSRVDEQFALLFTQAMSYLIRIRGNSRRKIHRRMSNPPSKLLSHKHDPYAMNENDRKQHGEHRSFSEMIHGGKSVYRGVIKCNYPRFEAYVWDNSDPGKRGRPCVYSTEVDAAKAHDLVSVKIGGLKALTNFPVCHRETQFGRNAMDEHNGIYILLLDGRERTIVTINQGPNKQEMGSEAGSFPDCPSGFGENLLGGNLELEPSRNINVQPLAQVTVNESTGATNAEHKSKQWPEPSNQEFGATQLPFPEVNTSFEPYNFQDNTLNQIPHENLNFSLSDSFQNPSSEPNNNGSQDTAEDAARAYDIISIKLNGWDALTNFHLNCYDVRCIMESDLTQTTEGIATLRKVDSSGSTEGYPQQLNNSSFSEFSHGFKNPNLIPSNPYTLGGFTAGAGSSSDGNLFGGEFPNMSAILQQSLQPQSQVNFNNVFNNQNLFINTTNNNINQFLPQSSNFTAGAGSSSTANFNPIGGEFPNQSATLQQPLQTPSQENVNTVFNQSILNDGDEDNNNNRQFLALISNFPLLARGTKNLDLESCLRFTNWPAEFGKKLLGGNLELDLEPSSSNLNVPSPTHDMVNETAEAANAVGSLGQQIQPVEPSNQEFGATQPQLPALNQSLEPDHNYNANILNQIPPQNLNPSFSDTFQINPSSEPNNIIGSQSQTDVSQFDFDMREYINILEDDNFSYDFDMFAARNEDRQGP